MSYNHCVAIYDETLTEEKLEAIGEKYGFEILGSKWFNTTHLQGAIQIFTKRAIKEKTRITLVIHGEETSILDFGKIIISDTGEVKYYSINEIKFAETENIFYYDTSRCL